MRCEDVLGQLNARADGELRAEDAATLDAHLEGCAQCRSAAESLSSVDAELRRAFVPEREAASRLAENSIAALRASGAESASVVPHATVVPGMAWRQLLVGLAAGFLLAVCPSRN